MVRAAHVQVCDAQTVVIWVVVAFVIAFVVGCVVVFGVIEVDMLTM